MYQPLPYISSKQFYCLKRKPILARSGDYDAMIYYTALILCKLHQLKGLSREYCYFVNLKIILSCPE